MTATAAEKSTSSTDRGASLVEPTAANGDPDQSVPTTKEDKITSMRVITAVLVVLALPHFVFGGICAATGIVLFGQSPIWLAYTVAPIWSGGCVVICGGFGIASAKSKTAYAILCFTAASVVSLITCVVSIQLLRLGLVNHTTDGQTFLKDSMDTLVMVALSTTAVACAFSVLSAIVSGLIAWQLKKEQKIRGRRRVLTKEEMIAERQKQLRQQKEQEKKVLDRIEKERTRAGRYHRI
ncbi:transmembrane protein 196-like [Acanthaster planci]|uniref:Transmembrane protein 196 n=1 Tax=Acanthaster planci TaxID=133434 RepID=A0A8B7XTB7_ACAPL|nr:transmembrane protein 196-like [Acanthaster planci]